MALAVAVAAGAAGGIELRYFMTHDATLEVSDIRTAFRIQGDPKRAANTSSTDETGEDSLNGNGRPEITNRLLVLRSDQSWSQAELARRLGVSRQTVNALERGRYHPSLPLAFKIARLFERPIEDVFPARWDNGPNGDQANPTEPSTQS